MPASTWTFHLLQALNWDGRIGALLDEKTLLSKSVALSEDAQRFMK